MQKKKLLLLHGAIGAADQLVPLANHLSPHFDSFPLNFHGHGPDENTGDFSIASFAADVLNYLNINNIASIPVFGYSMGGYVALYLAKHHPERIQEVMTLGTKFHWDEATASKETKMLDPEMIQQKVPAFAATLKNRHGHQRWETLLRNTASMMVSMGQHPPMPLAEYSTILHRVRICIGDKDAMVSLEETINVYRQLKNSEFMVFPSTPHPIEKVNVELLGSAITEFFR